MFATLLAKDIRRTIRNPWPWLLNLALPIVITAVIGFAFGGRAPKDNSAGELRIKFALVDEDQSVLSGALRSGLTQGDSGKRLDPIFVSRDEALRILRENKISAILVIPKDFTRRYLLAETNLTLEVIKNPAQSFMPAIIEELAGVLVTGLNAVSRNLTSELPKLQTALATNQFEFEALAAAFSQIGDRLKNIRQQIDPPLIGYQKQIKAKEQKVGEPGPGEQNIIFSVFAYILPGMASAFLLFIADSSMRDFHREIRMKTLDRQRTVGASVPMFIASKIIFTTITVALSALVLFVGGTFIFGIQWRQPVLLALACAAYSFFAAGFLAALIAAAKTERRAEVTNSILIFAIAFMGGSYLPSDNFPPFMRDHITTLMPNHWLIETTRALQRGDTNNAKPLLVVALLGLTGIALAVLAAQILNRRLTNPTR